MQLLHVKLGSFPHSAPQNRATFVMDFEHVTFRLFARITKNALKNHRHVSHQIHRIVVDDDLPRDIEFFFIARLCFPDWRFHCRSFIELHGADRAHKKKLSHCVASSKSSLCQNFSLNAVHFSRTGRISIVKAVQVEQTVHHVQTKLARK